MSEPLFSTKLPHSSVLTVREVAAIIHYAEGTLTDVCLHPRGCGACDRAVHVSRLIGITIPALYEDEKKENE